MPTWTAEMKKKLGGRRKSAHKIEISSPTEFKHVLHIEEKHLNGLHAVRNKRSHSEVPASIYSTMPRDLLRNDFGTTSSSGLDAVVPHITEDELRMSARFYSKSRPALPSQWTSTAIIENSAYFRNNRMETPGSSAYGTMTGTFSSNGSTTLVNKGYVDEMMRQRYRERSRERQQITGILKKNNGDGLFNKADGTDKSIPKRIRGTPQGSPATLPRRESSKEVSPIERPTQLSLPKTPTTPISDALSMLDLTEGSTVSISFSDERPISKKIEKLYDRPPSPESNDEDTLIITHF